MKYLCVVNESIKKRQWVTEDELDPNTMRVTKVDLMTDDGIDAICVLLNQIYSKKKKTPAA